jgi:hypothetical protein
MPPRVTRWAQGIALGGIIGVMTLLASNEAGAQRLFGMGRWEGALELGFDMERQETKTEGAAGTKSASNRYEGQLTVGNTGSFIVDPRLWTSSFTGTFGLFQEENRSDGSQSSLSGTLLGYSFNSVILADRPYSATIFTNRNENIVSREFGGRSELMFENRGGTFRLREDSILKDLGFPYLSSVLSARQELTKEETTVLGQRFRRDEARTSLELQGDKGFETSDLGLRYEFNDLDDREHPLSNFQSHIAELAYSLDFGENLNRRWDSSLRYFTRSGLARHSVLSVDEALRIDHYENLFTNYRYLLSRNETDAGASTTHSGSVRAQHRLYQSLTTGLTVRGSLGNFPGGERTSYGGQTDLGYQRGLPWNGRLSAGTAVGYQIDDSRFSVLHIDVIDEPHTAPTPLGGGAGFLLGNAFVIISTIVVVDTRGGGRLSTTLGTDYILVQEGNFTKIVPLATSPVILPGDPLVVNYSYEVASSLKFSTLFWQGNAGVDFGWIALSLAHEQSDQTRLSGRDGRFLEDRTLDTARLELRGEWERIRALASALYRVQRSTSVAFTSWEFGQFMSVQPLFNLVLTLSAQESFTSFTDPVRQSTRFSTRGDLSWSPLPGLFVNGYVSFLALEESQLPSETIREAGAKASWFYGLVEVTPSVTWRVRERGSTETNDLRLDLRMIRRF